MGIESSFNYEAANTSVKEAAENMILFNSDPLLRHAVMQIQVAEAAILQRVRELDAEEPDEN